MERGGGAEQTSGDPTGDWTRRNSCLILLGQVWNLHMGALRTGLFLWDSVARTSVQK